MKKLSLILSFIILISACKNEQTKKSKESEKPKKESVERKADISKIKFVLFQSDFDPKVTFLKLKSYLEEQGMYYPKLIVDFETSAKNADEELRPTYLLFFGNPKMVTYLIQENPEVSIELPHKAIIYKDEEERTWVMYKNLDYLKDLYFIKDPNGVIEKINNLQEGFKQAVINPIKTTEIKDKELK